MPNKHSKNASTRAFLTTQEKRKFQGYGTTTQRLSADSFLPFDGCNLCLKSCRIPVVTPSGFLYCKECILTNILEQKKQVKQWKSYEKQKQELEKQKKVSEQQESEQSKLKQFESLAEGFHLKTVNEQHSSTHSNSSYWIPSAANVTKEVKSDTVLKKKRVEDPMNKEKLKSKELIQVEFTNRKEKQESQEENGETNRYMCPLCRRNFDNNTKGYVLKKCNHTLCKTCFDQFVHKKSKEEELYRCCVCDEVVKEKYCIAIQTEGTGFAESSKEKALVKKESQIITIGFS